MDKVFSLIKLIKTVSRMSEGLFTVFLCACKTSNIQPLMQLTVWRPQKYIRSWVLFNSLRYLAHPFSNFYGENFEMRGCPTNHSFSQKTRRTDLLYSEIILAEVSYVLSQFTRLTDGQTDISLLTKTALRRCNAVIINSPMYH